MARFWLAVLLIPAIAAAPMDTQLDFYAPATFTGDVTLTSTEASFFAGDLKNTSLQAEELQIRVYQMQLLDVRNDIISYSQEIPETTITEAFASQATVTFDGEAVGLSIVANTTLTSHALELSQVLSGSSATHSIPDAPGFPYTRNYVDSDTLAYQSSRAGSHLNGSLEMHIYGTSVTVRTASGTQTYESGYMQGASDPTGQHQVHIFQYVELMSPQATFASNQTGAILALGSNAQLHMHGNGLIPLVDTDAVGPNGTILNGTWMVTGNLTFDDISPSGGQASAHMTGDIVSLQLNGKSITWPTYTAEVVAATGLIGALGLALWKGKELLAAAGLLTKPDPETALGHPKRSMLYEFICEHPGASFRELLRENDLPAGTARHHLNVLKRAELIMVQPHHQTLRFFENHGKYNETWEREVMLREPELRQIYKYIRRHEGCNQSNFLDEAQQWGWSRSTAQHRLKRLVESGVVMEQKYGRSKQYHAT